MTNSSDRENYRSENRQETYTNANGETHTHVKRTTETVNNTAKPNSYGNGYVDGRYTERRDQEVNLAARDNTNTANGLLIGVILTSLVTLGVAAFWYFNQRNNAAVDNTSPVVVPVPVPNNASPSPAASQSPSSRTTIIERTREVPVVIPQQQAPAARSAPAQPNINITVPSQRPAAEKAPTSSAQPKSNSSAQDSSSGNSTNTPTQQNNSDTSKSSPVTGLDNSNSNSSNGASSSGGNSNTGNSGQ